MRVATALVVCSSMQASRFQIPGSPVQKKTRDEGSDRVMEAVRLSRQAFSGSANFIVLAGRRFSSFANPSLHLSHTRSPDYALINAKKVDSINSEFMYRVFVSFRADDKSSDFFFRSDGPER